MSVAQVVTLGFGNGTLTGSVAAVVLLGFAATVPAVSPFVRNRMIVDLGDGRWIEDLEDSRTIHSHGDGRRIIELG
jgi:hypothetical protein